VEPGGVSPFGSPTNSKCQGASGHPSISRAWPPSASAPIRYSTSSPSPQSRTAQLDRGHDWGARCGDGSMAVDACVQRPSRRKAVPLAHGARG